LRLNLPTGGKEGDFKGRDPHEERKRSTANYLEKTRRKYREKVLVPRQGGSELASINEGMGW